MPIKLSDIIEIESPRDYKIHLATWNGINQPLDIFVTDRERWHGWNSYRGEKDDFNRRFIFSVIDFYHEPNTWLFSGIYEVLGSTNRKNAHSYRVKLTDQHKSMIGRLKLKWVRQGRTKSRRMERYFDDFEVSEILKEEYTKEEFCGYENINHDFPMLEYIFSQAKSDWKAALQNVKGVYLITDKSNGKRYVGSAYGDSGIWSRWSCYIKNAHGHNDELTKLIKAKGKDYARDNLKFALLEYRSMKTDDTDIRGREGYWKEVLLSRGEYGYNKN